MKKKKLKLRVETIRLLMQPELHQVAAGTDFGIQSKVVTTVMEYCNLTGTCPMGNADGA